MCMRYNGLHRLGVAWHSTSKKIAACTGRRVRLYSVSCKNPSARYKVYIIEALSHAAQQLSDISLPKHEGCAHPVVHVIAGGEYQSETHPQTRHVKEPLCWSSHIVSSSFQRAVQSRRSLLLSGQTSSRVGSLEAPSLRAAPVAMPSSDTPRCAGPSHVRSLIAFDPSSRLLYSYKPSTTALLFPAAMENGPILSKNRIAIST